MPKERSLQSRLRGEPASDIIERETGLGSVGSLDDVKALIQQHEDLNEIEATVIEKAPALGPATQELINKLRSEPAGVDLTPFLNVLDRQLGTNMASSYRRPLTDIERLEKIAKLEDRMIDSELKLSQLRAGAGDRQQKADERDYNKWLYAMDGIGRGGTRVRQQMERKRRMDTSLEKLYTFQQQGRIPTKQEMMDLSTEMSAILQGGSPTLALIEGTAYKPISGRINNLLQQMTGNPKAFYTPEILEQIKQGFDIIKRINDAEREELQVRMFKGSQRIWNRNPDLKALGLDNLKSKGIKIEIGADGLLKRTPSLSPESIMESDRVDVISPDGVLGSIPRSQLEQALQEGFQEAK